MHNGVKWLLFGDFIFLISTVFSADTDLKCSNSNEYLSVIFSRFRNGYRSFDTKCEPFDGIIPQSPRCRLGKPLKCENEIEGCEKDEWLAGLYAVDLNEVVPLLAPYCCKADNVKLTDCTTPISQNFRFETFEWQPRWNEVGSALQCWLINDRDFQIYDILLKISTCKYKSESSTVSQ